MTELGGMDTTSAGLLFANLSTALDSLTSGTTCSCVDASTPSVSVFDEGSPSSGLSNPVGDGVRRLSTARSSGNEEKDDWVDVGRPSTGLG